MRKYMLVSTGLALAFTAPAHAEKWFLVGEGDEDLYFADGDSVSKNGQYLQMQVIDSISEPIQDSTGSAYYFRGPVNFDCAGKRFENLANTALGAGGSFLTTFEVENKWEPVTAGTHAEALLQFACDSALHDVPISDPFSYAEDYWYYYYSDDEAQTPS